MAQARARLNMRFSKRLGLWFISKDISLPEAAARYQEVLYLTKLLRRMSINCVIDVGANKGQFASELRAAGYRGHICSFEPVPLTFSELGARFRGDPRWDGYRCSR